MPLADRGCHSSERLLPCVQRSLLALQLHFAHSMTKMDDDTHKNEQNCYFPMIDNHDQ